MTARSSAAVTSAPGTSCGSVADPSASSTGTSRGQGAPVDDVAYALEYVAPFRDDETVDVEGLIDALIDLMHFYISGRAAAVSQDVKKVTGRDATSFDQFAQENAAAFR